MTTRTTTLSICLALALSSGSRVARAGGFESLGDDGWAKARAGLTSLAEVRRAVGGEAPSAALAEV